MKVDYEKLKELNLTSLLPSGEPLSSFWILQSGLERFLSGDPISDEWKNLLIDVGILVENPEEKKKIVEPFNFMGNDRA